LECMQNEKQLIEIINSILSAETEEMKETTDSYYEDAGAFYYGNEDDARELGRTLESYGIICDVKDKIVGMGLTHLFPDITFEILEDK
jgi:hypothetical protein